LAHIKDTDALRLVFGEADGLPGLVSDWYGGRQGNLIGQFRAAGVEMWKVAIVQALVAETGCPNAYERSDSAVREREGFALVTGVLAGNPAPDETPVTKNGVRYADDIHSGQRPGFTSISAITANW
jgi:23S rRNA (cytosine1962-C5)-methyltransferase